VLEHIVEILESRKIFLRERKSNEDRALVMVLYKAGLSYEKAGEIVGVSHEAIREWYQKGKELFECAPPKERKRIAIDEKEIDIKGKKVYLWACVDVDTEEVLAVMVTDGRCYLDTLCILKKSGKSAKESCPMFSWMEVHGTHGLFRDLDLAILCSISVLEAR
jgi:transposase-like protein